MERIIKMNRNKILKNNIASFNKGIGKILELNK